MNRAERHKEAAKKVEDTLRAEGRAFEADQIRQLRMSLTGAQATLASMYQENLALRAKIADLESRS